MKKYLDIPLSPEAEELFKKIKPMISRELKEIAQIPISVLIWGPNPEDLSIYGSIRNDLRFQLRKNGHAAFFSEELCDGSSPYSIRIQQIVHAQKFDLVVSIPASSGSIGEAHDFAADRRVSAKMLLFLNNKYMNGYSNQSLQAIESILTCEIFYYDEVDAMETIQDKVLHEVQRIREIKYILSGRF